VKEIPSYLKSLLLAEIISKFLVALVVVVIMIVLLTKVSLIGKPIGRIWS
jgi:hypothetical protein